MISIARFGRSVAIGGALLLILAALAAGATVSYPISAAQNDASQASSNPGDMTGYAGTTMFWPYSNNSTMSYWRWPVRLPRTATITSAYVQVKASDKFHGDNNPSTVRLELIDSDNCPAFHTAPPYQMTVTASHVDSTVPAAWTGGAWYSSADLAALVQEFIARPGYEYGSALGLRGSAVAGLWKRMYQYDYNDSTKGAVLTVNFTGGEAVIDLWMADPEVRLGQKIYCQIVDAEAETDRLQGLLDGQLFYEKVGSLQAEEVVAANYRTLPAGQHTLTIQILDATGTVLRGAASRTWTKLHDGVGKVAIDENNAFCRNGVPFFPVLPWGMSNTEATTTWHGKINSLLGQAFGGPSRDVAGFLSSLDSALAAGLPFAGPSMGNYYPGGNTSNIIEDPPGSKNYVHLTQLDTDVLGQYIMAGRDHPGLFAWHWHDEPDLGGASDYMPATEVRRWTDKCHELDTNHPHIFGIVGYGFTGGPAPNYGQSLAQSYCFLYDDLKNAAMGTNQPFAKKTVVADAFGYDYYPYEYMSKYSWCNLEDYTVAVDRAIDWNYNLIPTYSFIETTDIRAANYPSLNYPWTPGPTAEQLRNLIWLTVIHNVKAIGWFQYFTPTPPANLAVIETFMTQLTDLTPVILGPEEVAAAVTCQVPEGSRVDIMAREHAAKLYILSASTRPAATTARFNVAGLAAGQFVQVYGEARAITTADGYFDDAFDPYGVHIYVIGAGAGTPGVPKPELCSIAATTPLWADGVQQSAITVTVHDGYDAPVVGEPAGNIVVSVAGGSGNVLVQPTQPTDANGQTVAYLSTTSAGMKVAAVAIRGQTLLDVAQVECVALPMILSYAGADLTQVQPGTTTGRTMTITCRDIIGARDLWALDIFRWIAATQLDNPQVRFTKFDDLTDAGSFNYAVAGGNGLFLAHRPATYGLDVNSYTELHKGADYFEFSLTEHATGYDLVTVYRINPSTPLGTRFTATRTLTNTSGAKLVPGGVMLASLILNDGDFNPRLATGQLSGYVFGGAAQHHQALPGPLDALWLMTDNLDRGDNPAFSAADVLWVRAEIMPSAGAAGLGLAAGRSFALTTDIVAYYPSPTIGNIAFDPRTDYLDGIHWTLTPIEWLGTVRANHSAGLPAGGSATKHFNLDVNIQSAGLFDAGFAFDPGQDWVYQNTAATTADRHRSRLRVEILGDNYGNTAYTVTVAKIGGAGEVTVLDGAGPLEKVLVGGRRTNGVAGVGECRLRVTVTGNVAGQAEADLTLTVRALGDLDGQGGVSGQDKLLMNKRLNGLVPDGRQFDLDGQGGASGQDKLILNKLLNGLTLP